MDQSTHKYSTTISRNLGLSNRKETQSGKDSCTNCLMQAMHKARSCAHTLHKDVRRMKVVAGKAMRKKLSKGWTALNKIWRKTVERNMNRKTTSGKQKRAS